MIRERVHALIVWVLFLGVAGGYTLMAWHHPIAYIWATYEDLYGEWGQTYLFALAMGLSVYAATPRSRYRWFFILLALACFYTVMEEISWGQRILGFESPDFFKSRNLQGETNLHNFLVGPYSTPLKDIIEYTLATALLGFGLVYPLLLRLGWRVAAWFERQGLASPPLYGWPLLATAGFLEISPFSFNEAEVAEVLVGLAMAVMALHYSLALRRTLEPLQSSGWPQAAKNRMAAGTLAVALAAGVLSFATTRAIYATPQGYARAESRINSGVAKFAGRYARYERWDVVIGLYEYLLAKDPDSTSTLRSLARAELKAGNQAGYDRYVDRALEVALERYRRDPRSASANRNLVRTYRMKGDESRAGYHLEKALRLGEAEVARKPESASAAYSLGRTYELMGQDASAYAQFKRAYELRPTSSRYRKRYHRYRSRFGQ